jgi:hypothetical protein
VASYDWAKADDVMLAAKIAATTMMCDLVMFSSPRVARRIERVARPPVFRRCNRHAHQIIG